MFLLDLSSINELLDAHAAYLIEKGKIGRGAPPKINGRLMGMSIYEACILTMSARLQGFVEEEFKRAVKEKFLHLKTTAERDALWKSVGNWGNPNTANLNRLFVRVGIIDIMKDFSFSSNDVKESHEWLDTLNTVRNRVAHGKDLSELKINNKKISINKTKILQWREGCESFGNKFPQHLSSRLI